jgi:hypothetical protein
MLMTLSVQVKSWHEIIMVQVRDSQGTADHVHDYTENNQWVMELLVDTLCFPHLRPEALKAGPCHGSADVDGDGSG